MTAARVLNPVVLTEFCKIRASPSCSAMMGRCAGQQQLKRIKRDLFGSVNSAETNKIFADELEKHQEKAIKKWGFDFRAGTPLAGNTKYVWERVSFQESNYAPEMYTLTRAAHVRPNHCGAAVAGAASAVTTSLELLLDERAERENFNASALRLSTSSATDTDSCDDSHDEANGSSAAAAVAALFKVPAALAGSHHSRSLQLRKRQPKITEYMKERKRLAQTPKKLSPAKRMRSAAASGAYTAAQSIGGGGSNNKISSSSSSSSSSISGHVAATFLIRKRSRNE